MFWTRISKALSDIILVVALVMALMLGEGFYKMLDSYPAGLMGFVIGIVIAAGASVAMKSLTNTSKAIVTMLHKLEGNDSENVIPESLEDVEKIERNIEDEDMRNESIPTVKVRWKSLSTEIKAVWVEAVAVIIAIFILAYKVSEKTQYGAVLILGFGIVVDMLINAIVGTAVENHHKMEKVNELMRTRNERKRSNNADK